MGLENISPKHWSVCVKQLWFKEHKSARISELGRVHVYTYSSFSAVGIDW